MPKRIRYKVEYSNLGWWLHDYFTNYKRAESAAKAIRKKGNSARIVWETDTEICTLYFYAK